MCPFNLGNDFYQLKTSSGSRKLQIGKGVHIEGAIIDKNVSIGDNCVISSKKGHEDYESPLFSINDGITIIPRGAAIPSGTEI